MQLVGYSSFAKRHWKRMQYYGGKIFEGKHRSREMHEEGDLCLPCWIDRGRKRRRIAAALQLLDLPKHKQHQKGNNINNKTTGAMHTHDDMTF